MRFVIEAVGLTAGGGKELALDLFSRLHLFHDHEFILFVHETYECSALGARNVRCIRYSRRRNLLLRYWALARILPRICKQHQADGLLCLGNIVPRNNPCPTAVLIQNAYLGYRDPRAEQRLTFREKLIVAYSRRALQRLRRRRIHVVVQTPVMRDRIFSMQRDQNPFQHESGASGLLVPPAVILSAAKNSGIYKGKRNTGILRYAQNNRSENRGLHPEMLKEPTIIPNPAACLGKAAVRSGEHRDEHRPFTFICLARYYAHKNLEILPQALKQLSFDVSQPFKCLITISAAQHPNARKLLRRIEAEGLGRVLMNIEPMERERLSEAYCSADALILPTLLESYTRTYSEAMHYGLPILTSDRDFARHLCGEAAIYFDPLDPASVAKSMAAVMTDEGLRRKLIAAGQRRVSELPSWDAVAAQFVAVMERITGNGEQVTGNSRQEIADGERCMRDALYQGAALATPKSGRNESGFSP